MRSGIGYRDNFKVPDNLILVVHHVLTHHANAQHLQLFRMDRSIHPPLALRFSRGDGWAPDGPQRHITHPLTFR